jgi:hypothetical protein
MRLLPIIPIILLTLAGLIGCAADTGAPPSIPGPATAPLTCDSGESYFYLMNDVGVPQADAAGLMAGFDLDARSSEPGDVAGCGHMDFTSPDGVPGVDNQFAVLANEIRATLDFDQLFTQFMGEGAFAMVIEVQNVDNFDNDPCVNVKLGLGYLPGGGAPGLGEDRLAVAGQYYDTHFLTEIAGRIVNGRLETETVDFMSELSLVEPAIPFVIEDARLVATISENLLEDGLIGGKVSVPVLEDTAAAMQPNVSEVAALIVNSQADLDPVDGNCTALSVGLVFSAVDAVQGVPQD